MLALARGTYCLGLVDKIKRKEKFTINLTLQIK